MKWNLPLLGRAHGAIDSDARLINYTLFAFVAALLVYGLAMASFDFKVLINGLTVIVVSPDILINDYIQRAGLGPAFVNAGLTALSVFGLLRLSGALISGPAMAAIFTVAGFSLFGKNIYNIWPIIGGCALFIAASGRPYKEIVIVSLFGTALAPTVSELTFALGLAFPWNLLAGVTGGIIAGFILPPIAKSALDFTRGYNLYNIGFSAGFVGTVLLSVMKAFGIKLSGGFAWGSESPERIVPYMVIYFILMALVGILEDKHWKAGYKKLLASPGRLVSDFPRTCGIGATLVNMGAMGLLGVAFAFATGSDWNGPVIGGILTMTGFGAFGKHPKNALPPMLGVAVAASATNYGIATPGAQMAALFVTTLAPISGTYGPLAGFTAGVVHMLLVVNVGLLHGGLNLYNNGFAGGMTAGILVPIFEWIAERRRNEH